LVDYWSLTGDDTYNSLVSQALYAQTGENDNYIPANQSVSESNDDQTSWGLAALLAAERNFTASADGPTWLELTTNVFDNQAARWDVGTCDGGLRWQLFTSNSGYDYKNSLSSANFFLLAARLAQLTGNQTFADWAEKSYSWLTESGFVDIDGSVFDGAHTEYDCTDINKVQFSNTAGVVLYGAAVMFNFTNGNSTWSTALSAVLNQTSSVFFDDGVPSEIACESANTCTLDMHFFKGALIRDMARTARAAPFSADIILPLLKSSAEAVATTACASSNGSCSFDWQGTDKTTVYNAGTQYSALEAVQASLQPIVDLATTETTGNATSTSGGGSFPTSSSTTGKNAGTTPSPAFGLGGAITLVAVQICLLGVF
jgi:mannan endo-1,6-alpha-mannosidase